MDPQGLQQTEKKIPGRMTTSTHGSTKKPAIRMSCSRWIWSPEKKSSTLLIVNRKEAWIREECGKWPEQWLNKKRVYKVKRIGMKNHRLAWNLDRAGQAVREEGEEESKAKVYFSLGTEKHLVSISDVYEAAVDRDNFILAGKWVLTCLPGDDMYRSIFPYSR